MSDEPLYCTVCGAEDYNCDCPQQETVGPYCEVCGVIPGEGGRCRQNGGTRNYCATKEEMEKEQVV